MKEKNLKRDILIYYIKMPSLYARKRCGIRRQKTKNNSLNYYVFEIMI